MRKWLKAQIGVVGGGGGGVFRMENSTSFNSKRETDNNDFYHLRHKIIEKA